MKLSRRGKSARRGRHTKRAGKHLRYRGKKVRGSKRYHRGRGGGRVRTHKRGKRLQRGGLAEEEKAKELVRIKQEISHENLKGAYNQYVDKYFRIDAVDYRGNYTLSFNSPESTNTESMKFALYQSVQYMYLCRSKRVTDGKDPLNPFDIILRVTLLALRSLPFVATTVNTMNPSDPKNPSDHLKFRSIPDAYTFPDIDQNRDSLDLLQKIQSDIPFHI